MAINKNHKPKANSYYSRRFFPSQYLRCKTCGEVIHKSNKNMQCRDCWLMDRARKRIDIKAWERLLND